MSVECNKFICFSFEVKSFVIVSKFAVLYIYFLGFFYLITFISFTDVSKFKLCSPA
jgi:hypothetical protein